MYTRRGREGVSYVMRIDIEFGWTREAAWLEAFFLIAQDSQTKHELPPIVVVQAASPRMHINREIHSYHHYNMIHAELNWKLKNKMVGVIVIVQFVVFLTLSLRGRVITLHFKKFLINLNVNMVNSSSTKTIYYLKK